MRRPSRTRADGDHSPRRRERLVTALAVAAVAIVAVLAAFMHKPQDGSVRTVEQPGAPAAGSRAAAGGSSLRVLADRPGQG